MSVYALEKLSDDLAVDHLLLLTPNAATRQRVGRALAYQGLAAEDDGRALRLPVGELDYGSMLENLGSSLTDVEKHDTRVAIIPVGADDRTRRKAVALARPLAGVLQEVGDSWLTDLLEHQRLSIHFQPLVQYPPGRVHGYECLVRGVTPDGEGLIPPARLFQAARRLDIQYLLDKSACKAAVSAAADTGFSNIAFYINLMPDGVERPDITASSLLAAVEMGGLRADQVVFDLVDAESIRDHQRLGQIVHALRESGFAVALDDVGAGSASLLPLEDLRPDYIKLDGDLCRRAVRGGIEQQVFTGLCARARACGAVVIAKGIETEDQLRFTIDADVPISQGYIHARPQSTPLDADEEDRMLRQVRRTAILAID